MANAKATPTKTTPKKNVESVLEEKEVEVNNTIDETEKMSKLIADQAKIIQMLQEKLSQPQQNIISLEGFDKVTVIHLKDYPTAIRLSNNKLISLKKLKQTQEITRSEALELANSYPKAFEKGWITFTGEIGQEILEANSVRIDKETIDSIFDYKSVIDLDKESIIDYYQELLPAQKDMFISWWYNEASSDDSRFLNIEVVNGLNKVSDGRFSRLIGKITNVM